mmetsp:Transcript_12988/g.21233  ORF Transcript_12988/g.21233 Transcript_12988/m.21233 type:complete len:82 (+) Transcript_12988:264-509(+)
MQLLTLRLVGNTEISFCMYSHFVIEIGLDPANAQKINLAWVQQLSAQMDTPVVTVTNSNKATPAYLPLPPDSPINEETYSC